MQNTINKEDVMLRMHQIYKRFGALEVLKGIDLEVRRGEVLAIIGPSGSGKSTLLRCLNRLETIDQGSIEIKGEFLAVQNQEGHAEYASSAKSRKLLSCMGMVFQQFNLFERRTALQNVMEGLIQVKKMPKAEAQKLAEENLRKVGLEDRMDYYPKFLSGGQKQRVGIARAMAMQPTLLLLDEPTSALDPELVGEVQDTILNAAKNKQTMVLVSHEMDFVYNVATKVLFLEKGKIIEEGSPEEVFHHPKNPRTSEFLSRHVKTIDIGSSND